VQDHACAYRDAHSVTDRLAHGIAHCVAHCVADSFALSVTHRGANGKPHRDPHCRTHGQLQTVCRHQVPVQIVHGH